MKKKAAPGLGVERELKFAQADLEALRQRLAEVEAERVGPAVFEENWLLDRDGELAGSESVLRVRAEEGRGALITFKGPARFEATTKERLAEIRGYVEAHLRELEADMERERAAAPAPA